MTPKDYMMLLMVDIIAGNDGYGADSLNDAAVWDRFMGDVFERMDNYPDEDVKTMLNSINRDAFQQWIDDPSFWDDISREIERRAQIAMTILPSERHGTC